MPLTPRNRARKIEKLIRVRIGLSAEARNESLKPLERMHLARAADTLSTAIEIMMSFDNLVEGGAS